MIYDVTMKSDIEGDHHITRHNTREQLFSLGVKQMRWKKGVSDNQHIWRVLVPDDEAIVSMLALKAVSIDNSYWLTINDNLQKLEVEYATRKEALLKMINGENLVI